MENSQSVQYQPKLEKAPTETPDTEDKGNVFIQLLTNYPWLFVGGLLGIFLTSAGAALYSLCHVAPAKDEKPQIAPVEVIQSPANTNDTSNPMPLWMIAVIAMGCASGCIIILRLLNHPTPKQKNHRHTKRYQAGAVQNQKPKSELQLRKKTQVFVPSPQKNIPLAPISPKLLKKPMMAILPPEQIRALNKNPGTLAEMMDIRPSHPLPSILRKQ